jgi:hypothetical protein
VLVGLEHLELVSVEDRRTAPSPFRDAGATMSRPTRTRLAWLKLEPGKEGTSGGSEKEERSAAELRGAARRAAFGMSAIRQMEHSPGEAERTCGCMGHTYDAPSAVTSACRRVATTAVTKVPAAESSSRRRAIRIALDGCADCVATS